MWLRHFARTPAAGGQLCRPGGSFVLERHAGLRFEARACEGIDLQIQALASDDRDEQLVDIEAVAAEHPARTHAPGRAQQLDAMRDEFVPGGGHGAVLHNRAATFEPSPNPMEPACSHPRPTASPCEAN